MSEVRRLTPYERLVARDAVVACLKVVFAKEGADGESSANRDVRIAPEPSAQWAGSIRNRGAATASDLLL